MYAHVPSNTSLKLTTLISAGQETDARALRTGQKNICKWHMPVFSLALVAQSGGPRPCRDTTRTAGMTRNQRGARAEVRGEVVGVGRSSMMGLACQRRRLVRPGAVCRCRCLFPCRHGRGFPRTCSRARGCRIVVACRGECLRPIREARCHRRRHRRRQPARGDDGVSGRVLHAVYTSRTPVQSGPRTANRAAHYLSAILRLRSISVPCEPSLSRTATSVCGLI